MRAAGPRTYNRRRVMVALVIGLGVVAFGGAAMFVAAFRSSREDEVGATLLVAALWVATGVACLAGWRRRGFWRVPAVLGVALSTAGCGLILLLAWDYFSGMDWPQREPIQDATVGIVSAGVLMAYVCLLGLARLSKRWQWVRIATIASASLLVAWYIAVIAGFLSERGSGPPVGVLIITTGCGTLCTVLLHWVGASAAPEAMVTTTLALSLTCPRCGAAQELPAGRSKCRQCGLSFRIEIEEEHCAKCGYVLYRLTSDRCPECGAPVFGGVARAPATNSPAAAASPPDPPSAA